MLATIAHIYKAVAEFADMYYSSLFHCVRPDGHDIVAFRDLRSFLEPGNCLDVISRNKVEEQLPSKTWSV